MDGRGSSDQQRARRKKKKTPRREELTLLQTTDGLDSNGVPADLSPETVSESSERSVSASEKIDVRHVVVAEEKRKRVGQQSERRRGEVRKNSQSCSLNGEKGGVSIRGNVETFDGVRSVVALGSREDDFGWDMDVVDGESSSETDLAVKIDGANEALINT